MFFRISKASSHQRSRTSEPPQVSGRALPGLAQWAPEALHRKTEVRNRGTNPLCLLESVKQGLQYIFSEQQSALRQSHSESARYENHAHVQWAKTAILRCAWRERFPLEMGPLSLGPAPMSDAAGGVDQASIPTPAEGQFADCAGSKIARRRLSRRRADIPAAGRYFVILPERMQAVQARIVRRAPFTSAWTRRKFGSQRRLVTLWAWLIRFPNVGPLPQISQE